MSAYVVEDKTINKIVSWLEYQVRYDRGDFISAHWLKKMFSELGYDLEKKEERNTKRHFVFAKKTFARLRGFVLLDEKLFFSICYFLHHVKLQI